MNNYLVYIDESGDQSLDKIDKQFPVFCLAACIFEENYYNNYAVDIVNKLKMKYFDKTDIILHSSEIRKQKNDFSILFNRELRTNFYNDIDDLILNLDFTLIAPAIDKVKHYDTYIEPYSPYDLTLKFIMERLYYFLKNNNGKANLIAEAREKNENKDLFATFNEVMKNGTRFISGCELSKYILSLSFIQKKANHPGHQIADLVAYPVARNAIGRASSYKAYDVCYNKFYKSRTGKRVGYGLKVFP